MTGFPHEGNEKSDALIEEAGGFLFLVDKSLLGGCNGAWANGALCA